MCIIDVLWLPNIVETLVVKQDLTMLALFVLGDSLRDASDPRFATHP